jgi:hypothetical protein
MDSYAIIDESNFPMIRIRFTGHKSTDFNFQNYLDETRACYRFGEKIAIIFDASRASIPGFAHQKMQANWLKENENLMKDFCAGTAYVIPNSAIRAILRMIFSLQKQPVPFKVFEKEIDAEEWVMSHDLG